MSRISVLAASAVLVTGMLAVAPQAAEASGNLFAVVDISGNLVTGNGVSSVAQLGTGRYEVTFNRSVEPCAYVATTVNTYSQALTVFTAGGHLSPQGVYVETKNQGGGLTDGPFHLVVACNSTFMGHAVVGYAGELVRSSPSTTLTPLGFGRYQVRFPVSVAGCAFLANVGDPGNELVFNPSGVYTGSGPDERTVYLETKNPGGGLQDGVPFHLAVVCPQTPGAHVVVVKADGIPQRGSALTSSFNGGTGSYTVATNAPVSQCATVATRGSVDANVPFNPVTVELVPGPGLNTVGIQVRELLFFGGNPFNEAFHSATVCAATIP
jgi:hypothetical protein